MKLSNQYSSLLLDSGGGWCGDQREIPSYIAFTQPAVSFSSNGWEVTIKSHGSTKLINADPIEVLDDYLNTNSAPLCLKAKPLSFNRLLLQLNIPF